MAFEKGKSGNPAGRPKSKAPTAQKLRELIKQDYLSGNGGAGEGGRYSSRQTGFR